MSTLNIPSKFKLDIDNNNHSLKQIIIIADPTTNNILYTLTTDNEHLYNSENNEKLDTIKALDRVSSVRVSSDFDSKKLKINRLRCTFYNYYNVKNKLSDIINQNVVNKDIYLFYKSPTTNKIEIPFTGEDDYSCAMLYRGIVSRVKVDDKIINITAEDKTQVKFAD